jgi:hypothetical protein
MNLNKSKKRWNLYVEEKYWILGIENSSPVIQSRVRVVGTCGARDFQSVPT